MNIEPAPAGTRTVDPWPRVVWDGGVVEQQLRAGAVSNGYLGLRGAFEEGAPSYRHGTFVNGVHETWPIQYGEWAFGFATTGQTIVNVPDAKIIRLDVDDEPFDLESARILRFERALDLRAGTLDRHVLWETPAGRQVLHPSRSDKTGELSLRAGRTLDRVVRHGFDRLLADQRTYLDDFWHSSDVQISAQLQQCLRWNLLQLIQASGRAHYSGIPAKGLTGLRDHRGRLSFHPNRSVHALAFRLIVRGQQLAVRIEAGRVTYLLETGTELTIHHREERLDLRRGEPVTR